MAEDNEPSYSKPASQEDLERRLENGNASGLVVIDSDEYNRRIQSGELVVDEGRDFAVEGNDISGYVGVDPIYQTYANESEAPMPADEGAEAEVFKQVANDGDIVKAVSEELLGDQEAQRDTDDTSSAGRAGVVTPNVPSSPTTPGDTPVPSTPSDGGVSSSDS